MLWHGEEPIGICIFAAPAASLGPRNRFFGLSGRWTRPALQALNRRLVTLARVVIHPSYRGAGLAAAFVRRSCELCAWPWIESLAEMGRVNPFFEKAGFRRVGVAGGVGRKSRPRERHSELYGGGSGNNGRRKLISAETHEKSRYAEPVYYIFDNRRRSAAGADRAD